MHAAAFSGVFGLLSTGSFLDFIDTRFSCPTTNVFDPEILMYTMPFPLFICQTPQVGLILSFTPLPTGSTPPLLSPHRCRKALFRDPESHRQNQWPVSIPFGLIAISSTVGDSIFFESCFTWSSEDGARPLNPSHLTSTPWSPLLVLLSPPWLWISQNPKHCPPSLPHWSYPINYFHSENIIERTHSARLSAQHNDKFGLLHTL